MTALVGDMFPPSKSNNGKSSSGFPSSKYDESNPIQKEEKNVSFGILAQIRGDFTIADEN